MSRAKKQAVGRREPLGDACLVPGNDVGCLEGLRERQPAKCTASLKSDQQSLAEDHLSDSAVFDSLIDGPRILWPLNELACQLLRGSAVIGKCERIRKHLPLVGEYPPVAFR